MSIGAKYPLKKIREGKAELLIPDPKAYIRSNGTYEPAWAPVFYNPRMVFSRDMTVLFLRYLANKGIGISLALDSLSGTGVRGIRFLLEPGNVEKVILNDIDPDAYELINENIRLNDLQERAESYCMDANTLHYYLPEVGLRAEFVDIDPFGSPIPFIDSAIWVARNKSYIAITATDTAALTGTHINACLRKYHARPLRLDCDKEMGLRILIASIILRGASKDIALKPIIAYYADYYYRIVFQVIKGARKADKLIENIGYIEYNTFNLDRRLIGGYPLPTNITNERVYAGPLWINNIGDPHVVKDLLKSLESMPWLQTTDRIKKLLETLSCEYMVNTPYYRLDKLCSKLHKSMPKLNDLLTCLRNKSYIACRSHFDPRGISTNAPLDEIVKCINSLV